MHVEVLLVDDEKDILKALSRILRRAGISSATQDSAEAALTWLGSNQASLIVSDFRMPGLSGTEFLAKVEARWPETGRIILTGHADFDTVLKAVHTGVVHKFLAKPWNNQELIEHIKTSLATQTSSNFAPSVASVAVQEPDRTFQDPTEIKLQVAFDTVVDGIVTINARGVMLSANASMERIFGYRHAEIIGENVSMLMPEPYRSQHDHYLSQYKKPGLKGILGNQRRLVGLRKDGEVFPIELSVNSMELDGETQFLGMIRDISRRVKAETQNQLLLDALAIAPYGVALFGVGDRLIHWNKQFSRLYKPKGIELFEGLTYEAFFRDCLDKGLFVNEPHDREEWLTSQLARHKNLPHTQEYQLTSEQWIEIKETQANNGSVIVSHFDISNLKHSQISLESAVIEAEHANSARGRFLAMMSHEIRTPLNGVLGILQLLRETPLNDEQLEYISHALNAGGGLLTIISDILDFSKIEADKLELIPQPCQIAALLSELTQLFKLRIEEKSIQFNCHIDTVVPEWIQLDGQRLRQVLLNLIGNAVKFTNYGGVSVLVTSTDQILTFEVKDTGPGIPQSEQTKIFSEFATIDSQAKLHPQEGAGLGLAISRKLITLMGGEIGFTSEEGGGTSFRFTLPLEIAEAQPPADTQHNLSLKGTVLVVDDSSTNRLVAKTMLDNAGVDVICACSGEEAIDLYAENEVDLILMDISMPGMSGVEAFQQLKSSKGWRETPVIAFTAYAQLEDKQRFSREGMQGHLEKPLDKTVLLQTVSPYLMPSSELAPVSYEPEPVEEQVDLLNVDKLDQLARDTSEDVLPELVAVFQTDAWARLEALETPDIDMDETRRHLHTLGSSGALYGLSVLSERARFLERCCLDNKDVSEELADFLELAAVSLDNLSNHMIDRAG